MLERLKEPRAEETLMIQGSDDVSFMRGRKVDIMSATPVTFVWKVFEKTSWMFEWSGASRRPTPALLIRMSRDLWVVRMWCYADLMLVSLDTSMRMVCSPALIPRA